MEMVVRLAAEDRRASVGRIHAAGGFVDIMAAILLFAFRSRVGCRRTAVDADPNTQFRDLRI